MLQRRVALRLCGISYPLSRADTLITQEQGGKAGDIVVVIHLPSWTKSKSDGKKEYKRREQSLTAPVPSGTQITNIACRRENGYTNGSNRTVVCAT